MSDLRSAGGVAVVVFPGAGAVADVLAGGVEGGVVVEFWARTREETRTTMQAMARRASQRAAARILERIGRVWEWSMG
jgi:hypothetical protein